MAIPTQRTVDQLSSLKKLIKGKDIGYKLKDDSSKPVDPKNLVSYEKFLLSARKNFVPNQNLKGKSLNNLDRDINKIHSRIDLDPAISTPSKKQIKSFQKYFESNDNEFFSIILDHKDLMCDVVYCDRFGYKDEIIGKTLTTDFSSYLVYIFIKNNLTCQKHIILRNGICFVSYKDDLIKILKYYGLDNEKIKKVVGGEVFIPNFGFFDCDEMKGSIA